MLVRAGETGNRGATTGGSGRRGGWRPDREGADAAPRTERSEKQKAGRPTAGGDFRKFGAGSTTDGKDVRRDPTLGQSDVNSAPQSFPILWWLGHDLVILTCPKVPTTSDVSCPSVVPCRTLWMPAWLRSQQKCETTRSPSEKLSMRVRLCREMSASQVQSLCAYV